MYDRNLFKFPPSVIVGCVIIICIVGNFMYGYIDVDCNMDSGFYEELLIAVSNVLIVIRQIDCDVI